MGSNDRIPTSEVLNDIADTEAEIRDFERKIPALETLGDKMSLFRAGAYRTEVQKRKEFIKRLQGILDERADAKESG